MGILGFFTGRTGTRRRDSRGARRRRMSLEPLAQRTLLSASPGDDDPLMWFAHSIESIVPGEVMVAFHTSEPIADLDAYVEGLELPPYLATAITSVELTYTTERDEDYLTDALITFDWGYDDWGSQWPTLDAARKLLALPSVEYAAPNVGVEVDSDMPGLTFHGPSLFDPEGVFVIVEIVESDEGLSIVVRSGATAAEEVGGHALVADEILPGLGTGEPVVDLDAHVEGPDGPEATIPVASTAGAPTFSNDPVGGWWYYIAGLDAVDEVYAHASDGDDTVDDHGHVYYLEYWVEP